jgi:hypothetical protein
MSTNPSPLPVSIFAASYDGKYYGRYPNGNKPNTGAALSAIGAAVAMGIAGLSTAASGNYLGVNLNAVTANPYYNPEQPFLNYLKNSGSGVTNVMHNWDTHSTAGGNTGTGNGADLVVDASGYVKTLTGISSTVYGEVYVACCNGSLPTAPGATLRYPNGSWTFQMSGAGSVTINGDVSGLATSSAGCSISGGNTFVSTTSAGGSCTFTATGTGSGFGVHVIAIPSAATSGNYYPQAMALYPTVYAANFAAGEIFNPLFKQWITNNGAGGYLRVRTMDWLNTNFQTPALYFTAQVLSGASSATISGFGSAGSTTVSGNQGASANNWGLASGTYTVVFSNGQHIPCTLAFGSPTINFSTPMTSTLAFSSGSYTANAYLEINNSWANRSNYTDFCWATWRGVPPEVCMKLADEMGIDGWFPMPVCAQSDWQQGMINLAYSGAGATIPGYAGKPTTNKYTFEFSNEVWNPGFVQGKYLGYVANTAPYNTWTNGSTQLQGVFQAGTGDYAYATFGATRFDNEILVTMGSQFGDSYYIQYQLNTPNWTNAAYTHHINRICKAPYFNIAYSSQSSATFTAAPTGTGGTLTSTLGTSYTLSAAPTNGAVSASLSGAGGQLAPGTYAVQFSDGECRLVILSAYTSTLTWTGPLTGSSFTTAIHLYSYASGTLITFSDNEVRQWNPSLGLTSITWTTALSGSPTTAALFGDEAAIISVYNVSGQAAAVTLLYDLTYANTAGGLTYSSVPSTGFIGSAIATQQATVAAFNSAGYEWAPNQGANAIPWDAYESGDQAYSVGLQSTTQALFVAWARDSRIQYCYNDPTSQLSSNPGYLPAMYASGYSTMNHYNSCETYAPYGTFGGIESIMQPIAPPTSQPDKYQGIQAFVNS